MGEPLMATPAIAGDAMYVRGEKHLFAIGKNGRSAKSERRSHVAATRHVARARARST